MADTGAPHFIPYVEPTDLVREYPAADEAQALAVAAGLTAAGNAGIGSNVVQAVKTDTFVTTDGLDNVPGLSVTITPTSATARVLLIASVNYAATDSQGSLLLADNAGNAVIPRAGSATQSDARSLRSMESTLHKVTVVAMVSPASTSPQTFHVQVGQTGGNTAFVNRNSTNNQQGVSTLTAIEVAS